MSSFRRLREFKRRSTPTRKVFILIVGSTVVLIGIALIFLPGPAFIVIPAGLALLATEFAWARRTLRPFKQFLRKLRKPAHRNDSGPA